MEIKMIVTENIEMEYIRFGSGKKNMVILPGIGLSRIVLSAEAIKAKYGPYTDDYTVYVFDRKNNLEKDATVKAIAKDTISVMEKLNINDIHLFGSSYGGMIAMTIAELKPELVKKLLLASTVSDLDKYTKDHLNFWKDNANTESLHDLLVDMFNRLYTDAFIGAVKNDLIASFMNTPEKDLKHFKNQLNSIKGFNAYEDLDKIICPTLVVASRNDQVLSFKSMEKMIDKLKCDARIYKNASHAVYDEDPFFVDTAMNFFNR